MERIETETSDVVAARANRLEEAGVDVVHLEFGEPDFGTPANIRAAAKRALDAEETHYAPVAGITELRMAIADDATARKGFEVKPDGIFVTVGGKGVMLYVIEALIEAGDEAIVPDPGYPIYASLTRWMGGTPVPVPIRQENDFRLDADEIARLVTPRTRLIVINSPANPTGGVLTRTDLERIAEIAREHDLIVLADEIYSRIIYEGEHVSIASLPGMAERTVVLDGFSKTYAMTGWRLGYGIVPASLRFAFDRLITNSVSCAPTFPQYGALEALRGPQDAVDAMVAEYRARRDLVVNGLNAIPGIRCLEPAGAFYVFPDVSGTGLSGVDFADRLLQEEGVAAVPGASFGALGANHIRFAYTNSRANLSKALERTAALVEKLAIPA
jgi:aspartate/methionine/tyrosine aminotransferase